jgi:hypothetical protein
MKGTWTVTRNRVAPIHTFTAPEGGWLVNSHIIELTTQLLIAKITSGLAHLSVGITRRPS